MNTCTLLAAAKINLYLEIIGDRPDGFHELVMVMQSVALHDRITLRRHRMPTFALQCNSPLVPTDHTNLACKAAAFLARQFPEAANRYGGIEISIEKNIPVGAGLAGGSANAAATLVGLNLLWDLGLTQIELLRLGAELGSDVPFCLMGGTAIATGRGEALDPIHGCDSLHVVLAKYDSLSVATPWAYQTYRAQFGHTYIDLANTATLSQRQARVHSGPVVHAITHNDCGAIGKFLHNDLEKVVLPAYHKVSQLRESMAQAGLGTMMSGSGPTVFTLTQTAAEARELADTVRHQLPDPDLKLWVSEFSQSGIQLVGE